MSSGILNIILQKGKTIATFENKAKSYKQIGRYRKTVVSFHFTNEIEEDE
jgi:hypothetical protein